MISHERADRAAHPREPIRAQQRLRGRLDRGAGAVGLRLKRADGVIRGVSAGQPALVAAGIARKSRPSASCSSRPR